MARSIAIRKVVKFSGQKKTEGDCATKLGCSKAPVTQHCCQYQKALQLMLMKTVGNGTNGTARGTIMQGR